MSRVQSLPSHCCHASLGFPHESHVACLRPMFFQHMVHIHVAESGADEEEEEEGP